MQYTQKRTERKCVRACVRDGAGSVREWVNGQESGGFSDFNPQYVDAHTHTHHEAHKPYWCENLWVFLCAWICGILMHSDYEQKQDCM